MKKITDKDFKYTPAAQTDISRLFKRVRGELKAKAEQEARDAAEATRKVKPLIKAKVL